MNHMHDSDLYCAQQLLRGARLSFLLIVSAPVMLFVLVREISCQFLQFTMLVTYSDINLNVERVPVHLALVWYCLARMARMGSSFLRSTMSGSSPLPAVSHSRAIPCSGMVQPGFITYR